MSDELYEKHAGRFLIATYERGSDGSGQWQLTLASAGSEKALQLMHRDIRVRAGVRSVMTHAVPRELAERLALQTNADMLGSGATDGNA